MERNNIHLNAATFVLLLTTVLLLASTITFWALMGQSTVTWILFTCYVVSISALLIIIYVRVNRSITKGDEMMEEIRQMARNNRDQEGLGEAGLASQSRCARTCVTEFERQSQAKAIQHKMEQLRALV